MTTPEEQLRDLRARIDATDEALSRLLIERLSIIRDVGALKAAHWPGSCHIRPGREGQMHRMIAERFAPTGFPPLMALAIWRQLIGGCTHLESPLSASYLGAFADHRFLAREYFGLQVGLHEAETLGDALTQFGYGRSNMLILPTPLAHDWWRDAAALRTAGLSIFASLPLAADNLPEHCMPAVALAAVTPEASGDDISYFASPEHGLVVLDGFITEHEHAQFLGAHPRPLSLTPGASHA